MIHQPCPTWDGADEPTCTGGNNRMIKPGCKNNVSSPQAANQAPPPTASLNTPHHYAIVACWKITDMAEQRKQIRHELKPKSSGRLLTYAGVFVGGSRLFYVPVFTVQAECVRA